MAQYAEYAERDPTMLAMLAIAQRIAHSPLATGLHAWTSMLDLCITQTEVTYPYNGSYLKVSPLRNGLVEFRYLDTQDKGKQWSRTVEAHDAVPRLLKFLDQLRWFPTELLRP
jgi:hypothetical protein